MPNDETDLDDQTRLAAIRQRVEDRENNPGYPGKSHEWGVAKARLELNAKADLRFLLDYIDRHQIGYVSRGGQLLLDLAGPVP